MDMKTIRELAEIAAQNGLTALEVCEADVKIRVERAAAGGSQPCAAAPASTDSMPEPAQPEQQAGNGLTINFKDLTDIKSPLVGIFYAAPSPESLPFVTIGSEVKKGDVLCIVEAMKQMNEITADRDGEIRDICIKNGDITEFGQVLFKMR